MATDRTMTPPQSDIAHWQAQQEGLTQQLERWGATHSGPQIDWRRGFVLWRDTEGEPVVRASAKALCSYDRDDDTLLMAWASDESQGNAVIDALDHAPDIVEPCDEATAWRWAIYLAEQSGASYLYRYASGSYLVFLGLWQVDSLVEEDLIPPPARRTRGERHPESANELALTEAPSKETPHGFVIELLDELRELLRTEPDAAVIRRAFLNHAHAFQVNSQALVADGADPARLHESEQLLRDLAETFGQRRFGLLPAPFLDDNKRETLHHQLLIQRQAWLPAGAATSES
ncbi:MAG: hypothetical protein KDD73_15800 [Anaerolineales bacterium]|nr:hypothetical protein [Anaerolineales bacterium]MCB9127706.1 hypothetical protein [Ardenticatenales bacterium]